MICHLQRREYCVLFPAIKLITMQMLLTKSHDKAEVNRSYSVERGTNTFPVINCDAIKTLLAHRWVLDVQYLKTITMKAR